MIFQFRWNCYREMRAEDLLCAVRFSRVLPFRKILEILSRSSRSYSPVDVSRTIGQCSLQHSVGRFYRSLQAIPRGGRRDQVTETSDLVVWGLDLDRHSVVVNDPGACL